MQDEAESLEKGRRVGGGPGGERCLSVPQRDGVSRLRHESFGPSLQQVSNCETVCLRECAPACLCLCAQVRAYADDLDISLDFFVGGGV